MNKITTFSTYSFSNKRLLDTALTHRSAGNDNNERLEYLGDAILGFLIAEYFYSKNEKQKSKEFFEKVLEMENSNPQIKIEAQKRLQRDFSV